MEKTGFFQRNWDFPLFLLLFCLCFLTKSCCKRKIEISGVIESTLAAISWIVLPIQWKSEAVLSLSLYAAKQCHVHFFKLSSYY